MTRLRLLVLSTGSAFALTCFAASIAFEVVPLEAVSETSSNASIGDLNNDGHLDIVLVKGRHWQLTSKVLLGDGKGHFAPGPPLPSNATKSYSGSLADMTRSGHLDILPSNGAPDPKLVLTNDGKGHFKVGGTYGDPEMANTERGSWRSERRRVPRYRRREPRDDVLCLLQRRKTAF